MYIALVRRWPASVAVAFAAAACLSEPAVADGSPPSSKADSGPVSALVKTSRQAVLDKPDPRKKRETQDEVKDNWPTDDFGRPLRECDVPWDFVPSK